MASLKETFTAKCTEPLTNFCVNLLVEEVKKENRTSSTFNKIGWKNIQIEFNRWVGLQYNPIQLKNKVNKLKKQYSSFKKLWDLHIKDNSEWVKFKKDGFPQYNELHIVFGGTYANGDFAIGNGEEFIMSDEDNGGGGGGGDAQDDAVDDPQYLGEHHLNERCLYTGY